METWRIIPGFPDYEASTEGRIRRRSATQEWRIGRIISQIQQATGYAIVNLYHEREMFSVLAHRVICSAYHGLSPFIGAEAAHSDGSRLNNRPSNLSWKSTTENAADRGRHGTKLVGRQTPLAKLNEDKVRAIRSRRAAGEKLKSLAAEFGVAETQISNIARRKTWSHVE